MSVSAQRRRTTSEEPAQRREDYLPSACRSQARSCSWMSWSPPAASSPVVKGKLVKAVPTPSVPRNLAALNISSAQGRQRGQVRAPVPPKVNPGKESIKRGEEGTATRETQSYARWH